MCFTCHNVDLFILVSCSKVIDTQLKCLDSINILHSPITPESLPVIHTSINAPDKNRFCLVICALDTTKTYTNKFIVFMMLLDVVMKGKIAVYLRIQQQSSDIMEHDALLWEVWNGSYRV